MLANQDSIKTIAEALYVINRASKSNTNKKVLYSLKNRILDILIEHGKAVKVGLQYSVKGDVNHTIVLVKVEQYYFHQLAKYKDLRQLPHLGVQDLKFNNPKSSMTFEHAIIILETFSKKRTILHTTTNSIPNVFKW